MATLDKNALDVIYNEAHTHNKWTDKKVDHALLQRAYDLAKMAPTSSNCQPMRIVFVESKEAKEKLKPCLMGGNVDKTMAAPVTAIIGMDLNFFENLPRFYPQSPKMKDYYDGKPDVAKETAFRNGSLQGAYFLLACRAVGLDCGPMSGFDNAKVDEAFFKGTTIKSNFIMNIGYGDPAGVYPRNPRPSFDEFCKIA